MCLHFVQIKQEKCNWMFVARMQVMMSVELRVQSDSLLVRCLKSETKQMLHLRATQIVSSVSLFCGSSVVLTSNN